MIATIFALFIAWVVVELTVMVWVATEIGVLNTIGLLLVFSLLGVWLTKRAGLGVLARARKQLNDGEVPADHVIDGLLVCVGGLMLIVPGFVSDAFGLLILFPPTRALVRNRVKKRWQVRVVTYGTQRVYGATRVDGGPVADNVIEVDSVEIDPPPSDGR
jgi:UPF0716 protein FxsA